MASRTAQSSLGSSFSDRSPKALPCGTVTFMGLKFGTLVSFGTLLVIGACNEPVCSELSIEDCEEATTCGVERVYRQTDDGQLTEDVLCTSVR